MVEIKSVALDEIIALRHQVLRPHQNLSDCIFDTDSREGTFHLGAFVDNQLVSIASFVVESREDLPGTLPSTLQYQLRAMATLHKFRHMGMGRRVVAEGALRIKALGADCLWCRGRVNVQGYYEKLGFTAHGEVFDYPPIGLHIVMYKRL